MNHTFSALRLAFAAAATLVALDAGAEVICPDTLSVDQRANPPAGDWSVAYTPPPLKLTGVVIFDGPPSQNHKVRPFSARSAKGELRIIWRLPASRRNFHLVCNYERTSASLVATLPPGVTGCDAVFDRRVSYGIAGLAVKRMVCS